MKRFPGWGLESGVLAMKEPKWLPFPDPRKCDFLHAPFGPGAYDLRNRATKELILKGSGGNCASRMCSILPNPLGCGTRKNTHKREYVLANIADIEYRCWAFATKPEALEKERELARSGKYLFPG